MRKRLLAQVAMAIVSAALVSQLCACTPSDDAPLVIGYLGGLSGRSSGLGLTGRDGALLAIEEANAAGGVDGRPVALKVADDAVSETAPGEGVRDLADAGAVLIVGPLTSVSAEQAIPVANELQVPLLSPTVSSTDFSGIDDYFLRTCADNRHYAVSLAELALPRLEAPVEVATVYDAGNASYTQRLFEHFRDAIVDKGGSVAEPLSFVSGENPDYMRLARGAAEDDPDCVFVVANAIDSALLCQQLRKIGFEGEILLSQWSASSDDLISAGGAAVEGALWVDNYDRETTDPRFLAMKRAFEARFGYAPNFAAIHSYDATRFALEAVGRLDEEKTARDAVLHAAWSGIQGEFTIDSNGDTDRSFYPMTIEDGRFVAPVVGSP